jgi:2,3-bisphosphoglycerate-dependent phosphoglycerate mutase
MERLILVRHGETDWNTRRIVNGDPAVAVGLTEHGRDEARRLGGELADDAIDLCVTTAFPRTQETADIALAGREVPRLVVAELGDPGYGSFEGLPLDDYRAWAWSQRSSALPPGGGEARSAIVERYGRGFRRLLALEASAVLTICHSLPVAYAIAAIEGRAPEPKVPLVQNAHPYRFTRAELERVAETLEGWCAAPTW